MSFVDLFHRTCLSSLSFRISFEKIFLSSCLRSRLKRSCGICVVLVHFKSGNGLSFPRMEGDEYCSRLEVFLLLCFPFFESCIRSNVFGFVVLHLWIWRNIKFWKMKGGRYCLDWDWIFYWFFFFFRFPLFRGILIALPLSIWERWSFEKREGINIWLTCEEEIKY